MHCAPRQLLRLTALGVALAGCGAPKVVQRPAAEGPAIVNLKNPDLEVPIERLVTAKYARIAPGDRLDIRVLNVDDLTGTFLVAPDGTVNLHLVGAMQAAGRTIQEFDDSLTVALQRYFRNIDVTVNLSERAARYVYVLGQVRNPGRYEMRAGDRVLHALGAAGGLNDDSRENGVVLLRRLPDGTDEAFRLEFHHIHNVVPPRDVLVQPDDIVFVPKGRFQTIADYAKEILEIVGRAATASLVVDDLFNIRTRTISVVQ